MRIYLGKFRIYQFIDFFILNPCFYNDYVLLKQNKYLKLISCIFSVDSSWRYMHIPKEIFKIDIGNLSLLSSFNKLIVTLQRACLIKCSCGKFI
jgi:hypothetical protein